MTLSLFLHQWIFAYANDLRYTNFHKYIEYQDLCMIRTIGLWKGGDIEAYLKYMGLWSQVGSTFCCDWLGVDCTDEFYLVESINWSFFKDICQKPSDLQWLPPSLKLFIMPEVPMGCNLVTAYLPRDLRLLYMNSCSLTGTLSLEKLPRKIEEVFLRKNSFNGKILVKNLPKSLRCADLVQNPISQVIVSNLECNPKLKSIHVFHTSIRIKIRSVSDAADSRVRITELPCKSEIHSLRFSD